MKVTLLNEEEVRNIFKNWGEMAVECYNTPKHLAEKVGLACNESEHYSGSRTTYIKFNIEGIDRGVAEQVLRHEIGVRNFTFGEHTYDENPSNIVKNMKSFRYVDMHNFDYTIPKSILGNREALREYQALMEQIKVSRTNIKKLLENSGSSKREAVEDSNYVLPRATNTSLSIGFTLEALIHYLHKRLCTRTQDFHIELAILLRDAVLEVLPNLKDKLVPQCEYLLWCPEDTMCCGMMPTKKQLVEGKKE